MIVLRIVDADLPEGWTHDATDWQVANDIEFKDIVVESLNDTENKTTKIFNVALDPEKEYYGRARMLLNTGWTEWGNIDIFQPKDVDDTVYEISMPSLIGTPILYSDSDIGNHDLSNFKLKTSDFAVYGNAKHLATSWFIETLDGKLVYAVLGDTVNLTELQVDNLYLEENKFYKVRAMHHGDNRDVSQLGTMIIHTKRQINNIRVPNLKHINLKSNIGINVESEKGIKNIDYIFAKEKTDLIILGNVDSNRIVIDENENITEGKYVLTLNIRFEDDTIVKYSYSLSIFFGYKIWEYLAPNANDCLYISNNGVLTTINNEMNYFIKDKDNNLIEESRVRIKEITDNSVINNNSKVLLLPNQKVSIFTIVDNKIIISNFRYNNLEFDFMFIDQLERTIDGIDNKFKEIRVIGPNKVLITVDVDDEENKYVFNIDTDKMYKRDITDEENKYISYLENRLSIEIKDQITCPEA